MEDVVVYRVKAPSVIDSWGRGTKEIAVEFCNNPKYPAKATDQFIGVDDWGHGEIVAASSTLKTWIGVPYQQFRKDYK
jgi:hypothetical protein